ncbi:MAG: exosortase system-associated protein, TIGR04073 family [Candidatus Omnitrophota bacterium]
MKKFLKILLLSLFVITTTGCPSSHAGAFRKLGRGISNTLTGWAEIFFSVNKKFREHDNNVAQGLTALPEGIVRAGTRTILGVYETLTFPIPVPANYETIMYPEFIFETEDPYERVYDNNRGAYL